MMNLNYMYSKQSVRNVQTQGRVCVLDIEIEGVKQIKATDLNPLLVFILPPSIKELERRLRGRNTETEESLQKRLDTAKSEIEYGLDKKYTYERKLKSEFLYYSSPGTKEGNFHIVISNIVLKKAYGQLREFVLRELETQRNQGIDVSIRLVSCEEPVTA